MARNTYFQFKQFIVHQENAAMKVGSDGVLLGAWAFTQNANKILDIGTGTGLVALMLAQRCKAKIDAIDIDAGAIKDATTNFKNSKWSNRLKITHTSLQDYVMNFSYKYDSIVCNPPFFTNGVQSKNTSRSLARHTNNLSFDDLLKSVSQLLTEDGSFTVILPIEAEQEFRNTAGNYRLFASKITRVKPKPSKEVKRVLIEFKFESVLETENELTFETETHHEYTNEVQQLLRDFYLKL